MKTWFEDNQKLVNRLVAYDRGGSFRMKTFKDVLLAYSGKKCRAEFGRGFILLTFNQPNHNYETATIIKVGDDYAVVEDDGTQHYFPFSLVRIEDQNMRR